MRWLTLNIDNIYYILVPPLQVIKYCIIQELPPIQEIGTCREYDERSARAQEKP
jgi:hypothetical protein